MIRLGLSLHAKDWWEGDGKLYFPFASPSPIPLPVTSAAVPYLLSHPMSSNACKCEECRRIAVMPILTQLVDRGDIPPIQDLEL